MIKLPISMPLARPDMGWLPYLLFIATVLFVALVCGVVAGLGQLLLILPILGLMALIFVLATPATWTVWLMYVAVFFVLGPVVYFTHFTQLQWLPSLMAAILLLQVFLYQMRRDTQTTSQRIPSLLYWIVLFLLLLVAGTAIDQPTLPELINASRYYFFIWPLMFVFMLGMVQEAALVRLWKALLVVVVIQLPFVLYQYFFVAKKNLRLSPWDAVVGTFPGNIDGGGQSAAMGITLLIGMLLAVALWRDKKLHGGWASLVVISGLLVIALAEVKAVVLLLPVVAFAYYRREILRRPFEFMAVVMVGVMLVGGLFFAYQRLHYDEVATGSGNPNLPSSPSERVLRALSTDEVSGNSSQLGRVTHLVLWWDINVRGGDIQHTLFGYGIGATQVSNIGAGELARRFPYDLEASSATVLLWEAGLLGGLAFMAILLYGGWSSGRLAKDTSIPELHRIFLRVGAVALFLFSITLFYKNYHLRSIPIQFLMMLMLGQAAYWYRRTNYQDEASSLKQKTSSSSIVTKKHE